MRQTELAVVDNVATITFLKPQKGNALCSSMVEELIAAMDEAAAGARLIVFRGEGRHFCTGLDLTSLETESDASLLHRLVRIEELRQRIEASPVETAAIGSGSTFGAGADLFAACDHRLALPETRFAFPGGAFGIVLGSRRLSELVGTDTARSILLARRIVSAETARDIGLVTEIVSDPSDRLRELAHDASKLSRQTVASLRRVTGRQAADSDLAELVRSASAPGLAHRIAEYRRAMKS